MEVVSFEHGKAMAWNQLHKLKWSSDKAMLFSARSNFLRLVLISNKRWEKGHLEGVHHLKSILAISHLVLVKSCQAILNSIVN